MARTKTGRAPRTTWRDLTWEGAPVATWANLVTTVRTVAAIALGFVALLDQSVVLLAVAYAVYWVGDSLDGNVARWCRQETRLGAVFDILSDRACCAILISTLAVLQPDLAPALAVYFVQFMVLDSVLSLAFLHWPIVSPNYFHVVDRPVWLLNWSIPAKSVNTVVIVLAVALGNLPIALTIACLQLAVKVWSAHRVLRLVTGSGVRE